MSRIPQPPSRNATRTPSKTPATPKSRVAGPSSARKPPPSPTPSARTLRPQTSLKSIKPPASPQKPPAHRLTVNNVELADVSSKATSASIREQIALKRAEAKKALAGSQGGTSSGLDDFTGLEETLPTAHKSPEEDVVDLGRWSVKETIERARTTGSINIASRALPCLPSALFEIHLGIKPEPLQSVPVEPPITTSSSDDPSASRRRAGGQNSPSWYEAQDLEVMKAWSNEILEIQPEISMFGSLKTVDLHNNKLTTVPNSFADLTALTSLDLSHNEITTLPATIWALPSLTTLNLSHNMLTSLPFFSHFAAAGSNPLGRTQDPRGDWFSETITRATAPLPKLCTLDVSHNKLTAEAVDHEPDHLPKSLSKLDLSHNPLGLSTSLIRALSRLEKLTDLQCEHASIGDDSFPVNVLSSAYTPFPALSILDLGETQVSRPAIEACFLPTLVKRAIEFEVTPTAPRPGVLRIVVGKRVIKEEWEIEVERRQKTRGRHRAESSVGDILSTSSERSAPVETTKEPWEVEAEQGMLTEGAKRRGRAAAASISSGSPAPAEPSVTQAPAQSTVKPQLTAVEKEVWEIEAEQGLLTAGGRRRARAAAAAAAAASSLSVSPANSPTSPPTTPASSPVPSGSVISSPSYYTPTTQTLTLPPSTAVKISHARSFSLAAKVIPSASTTDMALGIPTPTLPLAAIISQPLAHTLKTLVLTNRRMDVSFDIPSDSDGPFLPQLEELCLEGCSIGDMVAISRSQESSPPDLLAPRTRESLLPLLARLFPSLRTLDLSYNALTSAAFSQKALSAIVLAAPNEYATHSRLGLRHLRLRGNKLVDLEGFQQVAELFKGNREVPAWKLEELDIRDNEIGRLPPEVGLLPLDVFLVDGNTFRVPARRVWEREGTKGLLSWLRGRIE